MIWNHWRTFYFPVPSPSLWTPPLIQGSPKIGSPSNFFAGLDTEVCKWTQVSSHSTTLVQVGTAEKRIAGLDQTSFAKGALVCQRVWHWQKGCCHVEPGDSYISDSFMVRATYETLLGTAMSQSWAGNYILEVCSKYPYMGKSCLNFL